MKIRTAAAGGIGYYNHGLISSEGLHNHSVNVYVNNFSGNTGTVSANHHHTVDLPNYSGSSGKSKTVGRELFIANFDVK